MNRILRAVLSLLLISLIGADTRCAWAEVGVSETEIKIGSCASLTGVDSFIGQQTVVGAQSYLETVNARGGVYGRKIKLLSYDHKYNADEAIVCFNRLISEGAFALAFINSTVTVAKMMPMAEVHKIPMIGIYSGADFLSNPVRRYIINIKPSYQNGLIQSVSHLWNDRGERKIAIIYTGDAVGFSILEGVKRGLAQYGAEPAATASFDRDKGDVGQALEVLKHADPTVVFLGAIYKPSAEIVKASRKKGWNPLFVGFSGMGAEGFIKEAGKAADGVLITEAVPPITRTDLPAVMQYTHAMKKYFPNAPLSLVSLEGFVDAIVLVEGLNRAGKDLTREGLINAIEGIHDLDIGLGKDSKINFSPQNHIGLNNVIFDVIRDGNITSFSDWKTLQ